MAGYGKEAGSADELEVMPFFDARYKADPHAWYPKLTTRPPFWARVDGRAAIVVARFRDAQAIYADHETFSSVKPTEDGMEKFDFFSGFQDLVHTDPPDHTRLRAVIQPAFSPVAISRLETGVRGLIDELLEPIMAGPREFDLMARFARPLSIRTMLGILLNLRSEDFPIFVELSRSMALLSDVNPGSSPPQAYLDAWTVARCYCLQLIEERRLSPGEDLVGRIISAHLRGTLTADEVFVMLIGLFVGGLSSIASQLGNVIYQLLLHPEQYRKLVADPTLAASAFEESLRFDSAGLFNYKFARHDCEFANIEIPAGTTVYILQHAAGFDDTVFEDPFRFDICRKVSRHLGFGYGVHVCIGAPLARLVGRAALGTLSQQLPDLRLAGTEPPGYGGWLQERAPDALWLRY